MAGSTRGITPTRTFLTFRKWAVRGGTNLKHPALLHFCASCDACSSICASRKPPLHPGPILCLWILTWGFVSGTRLSWRLRLSVHCTALCTRAVRNISYPGFEDALSALISALACICSADPLLRVTCCVLTYAVCSASKGARFVVCIACLTFFTESSEGSRELVVRTIVSVTTNFDRHSVCQVLPMCAFYARS